MILFLLLGRWEDGEYRAVAVIWLVRVGGGASGERLRAARAPRQTNK